MIQCLSCKTQIPDDSAYCDQCAAPVLICPKCGTPGKGKFCSRDRTPLVQNHVQSAGATPAAPSTPAAAPATPAPQVPAAQPQMQPAPYAATMRAPSPASGLTLRHATGLSLSIQPGDLLGRREGRHAAMLTGFAFMSGRHGQLELQGLQWTYKDLGSTNGSQINGQKLAPNVPAPVKNGDTIVLGDQSFKVEIQ